VVELVWTRHRPVGEERDIHALAGFEPEIPASERPQTYDLDTFRKYVKKVPRKHDIKELQKAAILRTAHILRKVLM
jgi:hypothetical protein